VIPLPRHIDAGAMPPAPRTAEETGLPVVLLAELVLKVMHQHGLTHLREITAHLKLGFPVLESLFTHLRRETLVEVRRRGALDGDVIYDLTQAGRVRAMDALARNLYAGPAPVPLHAYAARVHAQSVSGMGITRDDIAHSLEGLTVQPHVRDQFGAAMNSGRAILVYGPAGSGKTYLCEQMGRLLRGHVAVPHAIDVGGEIIRFFDPLVHHPVHETTAAEATLDMRDRHDERWVLCKRPVVVAGGELTLEMLDLVFDPRAGFYHAPPHFKANNGLFLVDDLGRQLVTPRQILNRWVVPMEHGHDYLMLRNGSKFRIPFDSLLFFSTNMQPADVADEAFLRRIGHKIHVGELPLSDYRKITIDVCAEHGVPFDERGFDLLIECYHRVHARPLLACTPRDLVGQIRHYAAYVGVDPALSPELIDWAWHNYFASNGRVASPATLEETT
jgi:hypothetical protein